jgi:hypothetical protein
MSQTMERAVTVSNAVSGRSRNLILAAMIFVVAMTFIDQTIVSIAVPVIQAGAEPVKHRRPVGGQRLPDAGNARGCPGARGGRAG